LKYLDIKYIVFEMTAPSANLFLALRRASRTVEEYARKHIEGLGLGSSDYGILAALSDAGPLAVTALGKHVLLTSGSMTTAIDRLEGKGLVRRKESEADRRAKTVHLTPQGRALIRKAETEHERAVGELLSSLSSTEQREALRLLTKLGEAAEAAHGAAREASA
jgi:MarR family 2-MHQ and catechol resistance regulon transcriptional repressor